MNKIRVLHPITRLIVGGAQENTLYTAECLDPQRYSVDVAAGVQTGEEGELFSEAERRKINVIKIPSLVREIHPLNDFKALCNLTSLIHTNRYDVVHTHSSKAGILGRLAAKLCGVPVIVHTVHGWSWHDHMSRSKAMMYQLLERICASFTHRQIAVARVDIQKGLSKGIGRPDQYVLIRSAIPLNEFDPENHNKRILRTRFGIPADALVVGNIGRFSTQKNPFAWLDIAKRIADQNSNVHFVMVGDGSLRTPMIEQINKAGLSSRFTLPGLQRNLAEWLAVMDVFLLTSLWEGLPRVIPQAMAMRVPVVAHAVDGAAEAIHHGVTGFAYPPGSNEEIAQVCSNLLDDTHFRISMGEAGRRYVLSEFDLATMISQIDRCYQELLTSSG